MAHGKFLDAQDLFLYNTKQNNATELYKKGASIMDEQEEKIVESVPADVIEISTVEDADQAKNGVEEPVVEVVQAPEDSTPLVLDSLRQRRRHNWMSVLIMVFLSAVNVASILLQANFLFPYSNCLVTYDLAWIPFMLHPVTGELILGEAGLIALTVGLCAVVLGVYLLLYFLGRTRTVPAWITLILFVLDTVYLGFLLTVDVTLLVDIIFHIWFLVSMIHVIRLDKQIRKVEAEGAQ